MVRQQFTISKNIVYARDDYKTFQKYDGKP